MCKQHDSRHNTQLERLFSEKRKINKVLIATGGTGGHIFPAQALAKDLEEKGVETVFIGGRLNSNKYFKRGRFSHKEVSSSSISKWNILKSAWTISKGVVESLWFVQKIKPDLVVGFGSFYSFPALIAAIILRIPIVIFEPNALPGKVNKFFSKWALFSALQFSDAATFMRGPCIDIKISTGQLVKASKIESRHYFYLSPHLFTFLIFGGSQGAKAINALVIEAAKMLALANREFQVIHITGTTGSAEELRHMYQKLNILACVKSFEERMDLAWSAADVAICRAGAATVAEMLLFEVPAVLIPFPKATDDHQMKNALFASKKVGGALVCKESDLSPFLLKDLMDRFFKPQLLDQMHKAIVLFKKNESKKELSTLILEMRES